MKTAEMRQRLSDYILRADDKKVKAIYTMVEDEIEGDVWTDEFVENLNKRVNEFETGKVKGVPWEEVKKRVLIAPKSRSKG